MANMQLVWWLQNLYVASKIAKTIRRRPDMAHGSNFDIEKVNGDDSPNLTGIDNTICVLCACAISH